MATVVNQLVLSDEEIEELLDDEQALEELFEEFNLFD